VQPSKCREITGVSLEGASARVLEEKWRKVNRQRVARLIALLALGIAVGAALAYLALKYL
jgi:hypothetical protein